tara:strand:+ start:742 stop:963 length:222 start_codon:yes stop_codon:yes gene_type:complete
MLGCVLCENTDVWVYSGSLCPECIDLQNLIRIYKIDKINKILENVLVAKQFRVEGRTSEEEKTKIETRSSKKE